MTAVKNTVCSDRGRLFGSQTLKTVTPVPGSLNHLLASVGIALNTHVGKTLVHLK